MKSDTQREDPKITYEQWMIIKQMMSQKAFRPIIVFQSPQSKAMKEVVDVRNCSELTSDFEDIPQLQPQQQQYYKWRDFEPN